IVQQKDTVAQRGDDVFQVVLVTERAALGFHALQPLDKAGLVAIGLKFADEPGAGVGERLVVKIDGGLRGQQNPNAESAGLLEQRHERALCGRIGRVGRQVAKNLVEVKDGPQVVGSSLFTRPVENLFEEEGDEKHALSVVEVGDIED